MATINVDGQVNSAHLAHLLASSLREEGLRIIGPDEDGQTRISAHGVGEERLREAIGQTDPTWTPPASEDPDTPPPLTPRQQARFLAALTGRPLREVVQAMRAAAGRT